MKLVAFTHQGESGVGVLREECVYGYLASHLDYPGSLDQLIRGGPRWASAGETLSRGCCYALGEVGFAPPLRCSNKIICVGLNYRDHATESGFTPPDYPTLFTRFTTTLVPHLAPIVRPRASQALDFEGELVGVIGQGGRHIPRSAALAHVAAYSIFNDASIRDFQHRTPQWTVGKNFDGTGASGPVLVSADELPEGARGLHIETRLNGEVMQSSNTDRMIFDVATLVSLISEAMTLLPGDLIVTGTPSGVGHARNPKLYMKPGDVVEVQIEGIGTLRNPIVDEPALGDAA